MPQPARSVAGKGHQSRVLACAPVRTSGTYPFRLRHYMSSIQPLAAPLPVGSLVAGPAPATDRRAYRMSSIDILRGLVIVLMALDHVRDYVMIGSVQDPTADPATGPLLFLTRWITHFCAPTFVFLAGASAGLMARRRRAVDLGSFLLTRGLWLILLEALVISSASSFAPLGLAALSGRIYVGLQVIWAIGASMVVLAGVQYLGRRACLALGAAIVVGHNLLDAVWPAASTSGMTGPLWVVLHARQVLELGPFSIFFSYPLLPWIGVMLLGFGSAGLFEGPAQARDTHLLRIGAALLVTFVVLRVLGVYGDPHPWDAHAGGAASVMSFLATSKYPPSLLYILMTLGPAAMVCACAERLPASVRAVLLTFGRAPLAFYVAHLYLIHALKI